MLAFVLIATALPLMCHGTGEITEVDLANNGNNQGLNDAVQFALTSINSHSGDNEARTLVKIVHATQQVVAGMSYNLVLDVTSGKGEERCSVSLWSQPWLDHTEVTRGPNCLMKAQSIVKRQVFGGEKKVDMSDTLVKAAFAFGVDSLNAMENGLYYRKPLATDNIEATRQVVSGYMYRFKNIPMANTDCRKMSIAKPELNSCNFLGDNSVRTCEIAVWYQDWMTPKYKIDDWTCN